MIYNSLQWEGERLPPSQMKPVKMNSIACSCVFIRQSRTSYSPHARAIEQAKKENHPARGFLKVMIQVIIVYNFMKVIIPVTG